MPNTDPAGNGWHLDKRVPLALIVTIFLQTVGVVIWATQLSDRVAANEKALSRVEGRGDRVTRLEANQGHISRMLERIESKLDRLTGK